MSTKYQPVPGICLTLQMHPTCYNAFLTRCLASHIMYNRWRFRMHAHFLRHILFEQSLAIYVLIINENQFDTNLKFKFCLHVWETCFTLILFVRKKLVTRLYKLSDKRTEGSVKTMCIMAHRHVYIEFIFISVAYNVDLFYIHNLFRKNKSLIK